MSENLTQVVGANTPVEKPNGGKSPFVKKLPEVLIFKLLGDPRGKKHYIPMDYYKHMVGPNKDKDVRQRASLRDLGLASSAPENEIFWDCIKKMGALKKEGKNAENSEEFRGLVAKKKLYQASNKGWFYLVTPGSPEITPYLFGKSIIDQLFGGEKYDATTRSNFVIPSLLKKLQQDGHSPYDITKDTCWLKLTKTGSGLGTRYTLEMLTTDGVITHEGRQVKVVEPESKPVHEKIRNGQVTLDDFPDPIEFEKKFAFTEEETIAFIQSEGTVVPDRLLKKAREDSDMEQYEESEGNAAPQFAAADPDSIAF
jgi:hypothetical protein